jgi:rare lipoprotein A
LRPLLALFLLVLLNSCVSYRAPDIKDSAPPAIDPDLIVDAVPKPDPISDRGNHSPYEVWGKTYEVMPTAVGYVEEGVASWYGLKFQGRPTSSGEPFDVYQATAAHKSLPLPTYVRVTNMVNNRSMVVKVNDRGPFIEGRLLDVSYGVAVKLGFADAGTTRVRVEAIDLAGTDDWRGSSYRDYSQLQVAAFQSPEAAEALAEAIRGVLADPTLVSVSELSMPDGTLYRVRVGPLADNQAVEAMRSQLIAHDFPEAQPLP